MKLDRKVSVLFLTGLGLILLVSSLAYSLEKGDSRGDKKIKQLTERADRVAREAREETRTEDRLRDALRIYRDILELDPDNRHALNRLSVGYFTLAEAYLVDKTRREASYQEGYEYGLKSLETNEDFADLYAEVGKKALKDVPKSVENVEGLFWTGANLGRLGETKGVLESLGDLPVLIALNRRVVELNESYLGGAAHRALASIAGELLSRLPFTIFQVHNNNFSWKKVRKRFERAVKLAPDCLENYFSYAKYYALKRKKMEMAENLLEKVLSEPLGDDYPLTNSIAKSKARALKEEEFG